MVEIHSVQFVQQFLANVALPCYLAVTVKFQSYLPAVMVDDVIHRTDVKSDAPPVLLELDVGEAADIQTEVVVSKKQPVANRYEWSALPT